MEQQSHITLSMEQFNLLMGKMDDLATKIENLENNLQSTIKYFTAPPAIQKTERKLTNAEKRKLHREMLDKDIFNKMKKGS